MYISNEMQRYTVYFTSRQAHLFS